jgi:hypothetical protein
LISQIVTTFFLLEKKIYSLKTKRTKIEGVCQNTKNHCIQKRSIILNNEASVLEKLSCRNFQNIWQFQEVIN